MDEKINLSAIDEYSDQYASRLASLAFAKKDKITGPEILQLCEVKQVNLFVVQELMRAWKDELQKLRSPYFDYLNEEVAKSLHHFQNTLSNHILVGQQDFLPLLKKAVAQTLYVILDPYDFYSDILDREGQGNLQVADLKNDVKYLKINRQPMEKLVQKLEERKSVSVAGNEAFGLLDSILEEVNFTPEDIDAYISQFSKLVPLELTRLYEHKVAARPKTELPKGKVETVPVNAPSPDKVKVAVNHFHKINQIRESLTINQKFMFTKILFGGDFEVFSKAIDYLDNCGNLSEALTYVQENYSTWDQDTDEYLEFREMLEKRFA